VFSSTFPLSLAGEIPPAGTISESTSGAHRLFLMHALGELLGHLSIERRNIIRVPAGYQALVYDNFLIDPLGPCIA
jgi:hypothetical protein